MLWQERTYNMLRCSPFPIPRVRVRSPQEQKPYHGGIGLETGNVQRGQALAVLRAYLSPSRTHTA